MSLELSESFVLCDQGLLSAMKFPGSHHLHLDPGDSEPVTQTILEFLTTNNSGACVESSASDETSGVGSASPSTLLSAIGPSTTA
jgi:hypothetical protein